MTKNEKVRRKENSQSWYTLKCHANEIQYDCVHMHAYSVGSVCVYVYVKCLYFSFVFRLNQDTFLALAFATITCAVSMNITVYVNLCSSCMTFWKHLSMV